MNSVKDAYNSWAQQYDSNENKTRDLEARSLRETLAPLSFAHCLEIGCGTGKNTVWLMEKAATVTAVDLSEEMLRKAKEKITADDKVDIQNRTTYVADLNDLADADLVIEAIVENLEVKRKLFAELESIVAPTTILASNTSSLSIASIAASCQKSERVIGIHFFNPAPLMQLVEVIPAVQTAETVLQTAVETIRSWKKVVAVAKDTPGFIVNRVARPFYSESLRIYEEGMADFATIDWALKTVGGFRMGAFELMDFIGNDVNYAVTESVFTSFYFDPRYKPSFTQKRLSEAGFYGRKSGRGFYDYSTAMPQPTEDTALAQCIFQRVIVMLINEAADAHFQALQVLDGFDAQARVHFQHQREGRQLDRKSVV